MILETAYWSDCKQLKRPKPYNKVWDKDIQAVLRTTEIFVNKMLYPLWFSQCKRKKATDHKPFEIQGDAFVRHLKTLRSFVFFPNESGESIIRDLIETVNLKSIWLISYIAGRTETY